MKMLGHSVRYIRVWHRGGAVAINNYNIGTVINDLSFQTRGYARDKGTGCCSDIKQTKGREVVSWSSPDCNPDAKPPTSDPYRIKVPEIVVPPLPPSSAKWTGVVLVGERDQHQQGSMYPQHGYQQQTYDEHGNPVQTTEEEKDEGWMGVLKSLFGRGKKEKESQDQFAPSTLQWNLPMLDCAKQRGPCSGKPAPDPPPCPPPPPPPPRSWFYPMLIGAILSFLGLFYKYYLYLEEKEKRDDSKPVWRPRPKTRRPFHEQDLPACVQYLIVGTGAAGWAAYRSIMEHDKTAKVFFVTKEDAYPYVRPPLSKHMWWNGEPPDIRHLNYVSDGKRKSMYYAECKHFMDPVKFYRKPTGPAVSIAMGWCVVRVDADEHIAYVKTMCGERPIYYERALLAIGSKPNNISIFATAPKFVRERVTRIRTIRDLEIAYRKVREAKHVTIIGGGHLGAELAWHMGKMHKEWFPPAEEDYVPPQILHVFKDKGILAGILPEYLSEWAAEKIKCENVTLLPKTQVYDAFESADGRLELTLSNGKSLITDYVIVAVGTSPREELAEPSFLELDPINGGYKVNTELEARTHLYVAGDAASVYSQWKNTRMRMEHFSTAEQQGYIAGANMAGYWTPCNMEPHWWFKIDDEIHMEVVGEVGACMPIVALFRLVDKEPKKVEFEPKPEDLEKPCYKDLAEYKSRYSCGILFYLRDEYVVGIVFWNLKPIEDRMEVATEILRARPTYEDISLLAELLGFPDQECITYIPQEHFVDKGPCIDTSRSKWMPYEEYDKVRQLSKVETPEIVAVYPKREI